MPRSLRTGSKELAEHEPKTVREMERGNLRGVGRSRAYESHRVITGVRGRPLGVLHVGFDELEGEPAESREKRERERERGWASGVEVLVR